MMKTIKINQKAVMSLLMYEWSRKTYAEISELSGISVERLHRLTDLAILAEKEGII